MEFGCWEYNEPPWRGKGASREMSQTKLWSLWKNCFAWLWSPQYPCTSVAMFCGSHKRRCERLATRCLCRNLKCPADIVLKCTHHMSSTQGLGKADSSQPVLMLRGVPFYSCLLWALCSWGNLRCPSVCSHMLWVALRRGLSLWKSGTQTAL